MAGDVPLPLMGRATDKGRIRIRIRIHVSQELVEVALFRGWTC